MTNFKRTLIGSAFALILCSCAASLGSFPPSAVHKGQVVSASLTHFSLFYLFPPRNLDRLTEKLAAQCPEGRVEGITVTQSQRFWHLIGGDYHFRAAGVCVR
jgi:hypothetical protein